MKYRLLFEDFVPVPVGSRTKTWQVNAKFGTPLDAANAVAEHDKVVTF